MSLCLLRWGHVKTFNGQLLALQLYGKTAIQKYYPDRNYAENSTVPQLID